MSSIWRPFTQMKMANKNLPIVSEAKGPHLLLKNGKKIIDAISSWWVITHGHCEPEIVKAIQNQSQKLDQILFANFTHEPAENLVSELLHLLPKNLQKVFFSDNGSTAVEVALKMSLQSWSQKGEPNRKKFLSFSHSYHGDTVGAMSVSAPSVFTKPYKPLLFSIELSQQGHFSTDNVKTFYEDFERKLEKHHKNLAAVIIEPFIQGAGGMIIWPKEALEHICQITKDAGIYLIFDEVMTGFGRTGTLFAMEQLRTKPDILCLSKGLTGGFLPLALTISSKDIYEDFLSNKKETALFHGHSFTGNPISCSAAHANLKLLRENKQDLENKWRFIESIHKERGQQLQKNSKLKDVRWKGLIAAAEINNSRGYESSLSEKWSKKALDQGVFLRPLGGTIYILPPYCISKEDLHKTWDIIEGFFKS